VVCEDKRTERFLRELLRARGFDVRRVRFDTAPAGRGAAEAWVRHQISTFVSDIRRHPGEDLFLVAVRDGDTAGVARRKRELEEQLTGRRSRTERIAALVPTWSIETWLLALNGEPSITEARAPAEGSTWKQRYNHVVDNDERPWIQRAARAWETGTLPSLVDARDEILRIEP
jgi:hypothetical protein